MSDIQIEIPSIESLTDEQSKKFDLVVKEWFKIGTCTDEYDRELCRRLMIDLYGICGEPAPKVFIYLDSPMAANYLLNIIVNIGEWDIEDKSKMTFEALRKGAISSGKSLQCFNLNACYGQFDASWLCVYDFIVQEFPVKNADALKKLMILSKEVNWFFPTEEFVIFVNRPIEIHWDREERLHSLEGPAVKYRDGWGVYSVHGVRCPERIVMQPQTITVQEIDNERNAELRRIMLDQYTIERYLIDGKATVISQDDFGTLYHKNVPTEEEPLCMVKVTNTTPEPDGSFKHYFLRVSPNCLTAHEAVASSFNLRPEQYQPVQEA